jgi:hypothetical protein
MISLNKLFSDVRFRISFLFCKMRVTLGKWSPTCAMRDFIDVVDWGSPLSKS